MKNILILGATGSIGESVLSVIKQNYEKLNLFGISFNQNIAKGKQIIDEFSPSFVHIDDLMGYNNIEKSENSSYLNSIEDLENLINHQDIDIIVCAISGFAGLNATHMAVHTGKKLLLANKESIVAGGDLILPIAKEYNTEIIPIDSEHNAIFQCLNGEKGTEDVREIIITASGGPFLNSSVNDLKNVTLQDALNHPNWKMGKKVTIDSATLVNKCLELIEAHYLFNIPESQIEIIVHPQSIIHSMITFIDGSTIAQMSNPSMEVPISNALGMGTRLPINFQQIDFSFLSYHGTSFFMLSIICLATSSGD